MHGLVTTGNRASQRGVGLIEVMIAVLVLAVGMLGVAAMQAMALRNNQSAVERTAAVMQTYAILDALRVDRDRAEAGQYNITAWACDTPDAGSFVNNELGNWITWTQETVHPEACVQLVCGTNQCSVQIRWDDTRGTGGGAQNNVITVSQL